MRNVKQRGVIERFGAFGRLCSDQPERISEDMEFLELCSGFGEWVGFVSNRIV